MTTDDEMPDDEMPDGLTPQEQFDWKRYDGDCESYGVIRCLLRTLAAERRAHAGVWLTRNEMARLAEWGMRVPAGAWQDGDPVLLRKLRRGAP